MIPALAFAACVAIAAVSDRIVAGDLAPVSPAFAALEPGAIVGWAPAPGVQRIFSSAELRRIAARLGASVVPETSLCVERRMVPLEAARVEAALQAQTPSAATLKLVDFRRTAVPEGELIFPKAGLRHSAGATYWNGYVQYGAGRRFAVWAKVELRGPVVITASDLSPGRAIESAQVRMETRQNFESFASSLEEVIGKWPRRSIRAGTAISPQWLEQAPEILRGESLKVEVRSGGARLELDGHAESSAGLGDRVAVRNPDTQKRFFARVVGKGRVLVTPAANGDKP